MRHIFSNALLSGYSIDYIVIIPHIFCIVKGVCRIFLLFLAFFMHFLCKYAVLLKSAPFSCLFGNVFGKSSHFLNTGRPYFAAKVACAAVFLRTVQRTPMHKPVASGLVHGFPARVSIASAVGRIRYARISAPMVLVSFLRTLLATCSIS